MHKVIINLWVLILITQVKLFGQNCECKIIFTSFDSIYKGGLESIPRGFYYMNDTLLVIKYGTALTQVKFSFKDFENDGRPPKNDTLIIKNGELLQKIGDTQIVAFSPQYFSLKKPTYLYKFFDKHKDGYFEVIKYKYEPVRKERIKGKIHYKYLSKTYNYISTSKGMDADSVRQNMHSIGDDKFKTDHEDDMYLYFIPGQGFLIDLCNKDLPLHVYFNQYKDTSSCDRIIKRRFRSWK